MSTSSNLHWVDYAVIIGYFAVVIAVGIFSSIKVFVPFIVKQVFTAYWIVTLQNGTCPVIDENWLAYVCHLTVPIICQLCA